MFIDKITKEKKKYYGGGNKPKPHEERKVQVYAYVPRKYYMEFQSLVNELAKQYR